MHNEKPLVSVQMLTYNHEKYISQAIEGVLMQKTDFPVELIIGEDCSTDNTRKIVTEYAKKFPDIIKPLLHEKNVGAKANGVAVREMAKGKYIAFCEGDDYWTDPYKLQKQIECLESDNKLSMSFHVAKRVDVNGEFIGSYLGRLSEKSRKMTFSEIGTQFLPTASLVIKKDILDNLPYFYYWEEAGDFVTRLFALSKGDAYYLNETMAAYRVGVPGSANDRLKRKTLNELKEYYLTRLKILNEFNKYANYKFNYTILKAQISYKLNIIQLQGSVKSRLKSFFKLRKEEYFVSLNGFTKFKYLVRVLFPKLYHKLSITKNKIKDAFQNT